MTRGHVLTHLARNADGGRRLLEWARTGVEQAEYPSAAARATEIEAGAGRAAADLVADLRDSAERFAAAYRAMPPEAWQRTVRWTGGQRRPAARAADARLTEVLVHHVDLNAGYAPDRWPSGFVGDMLGRVVASFDARVDAPATHLVGTDTGATYVIGSAADAPTVRGPQHALLAWLMGRGATCAADLTVTGASRLPEPPFLY